MVVVAGGTTKARPPLLLLLLVVVLLLLVRPKDTSDASEAKEGGRDIDSAGRSRSSEAAAAVVALGPLSVLLLVQQLTRRPARASMQQALGRLARV